ncbi:MAG: gliding motility-associated C-terminal domain-containing protein [Lewinellaceae bacterium]|nr:gliding motility-associated C-terminal domain-containing protein [Lewinellaceae bacterium]
MHTILLKPGSWPLATRCFIFLAVLAWPFTAALAQPANDDCANAIMLSDVSSWCSNAGAYNNNDATDSGQSPSCFPNNQANNDVWFSFVAQATDVTISVTGDIPFNAGGTLNDPQFALYLGDCGNLVQEACASDAFNDNAIQLMESQLEIGQTYYIQVSARSGQMGTFQLCVNNYNAIPDPSSDCSTGVILCNKDPFTVQFVSGVGNNPNEIGDVSCASLTCPLTESSSTWYKWTCDQAGSLTFTLTPLNPADDLDFVLYELPNGIDDCSGKFDLRCMASGENVGSPFSEWFPCTGATGLSLNDPDVGETCGCQTGDNNYAQAVNMEAGKSYALVINNFSQSGAGFSIEFGGTGTFLGPTADFSTSADTVCIGEAITFTDGSSFSGGIVSWEWTFGQNASPTSTSGVGPHNVTYNRPGLKSIVLRVATEDGCIVTKVGTIYVRCCADHFTVDGDITDVSCPSTSTGAIDLSAVSGYGPYTFNWSSGQATEDISGLETGAYQVTITDAATCSTTAEFTVGGPPPYQIDTLIGMPTCNGGMDGSITLNVAGASPPYQFSWQGGPFGPSNSISNLPVGDYPVTIRDANNCSLDLVIAVRELELVLDPNVVAAVGPSCTGFSDGSITLVIANGLQPYLFDFNDGNGFVSANSLNNLPAGVYNVDVQDANLCVGNFTFSLEDPPLLELAFDAQGISCFGETDGVLTAAPTGGVGGYMYSWAGGQNTATLDGLGEGQYFVTVTDANGCVISGDTSLVQPAPVFISLVDVVNVLCFGDTTGSISVAGSGGVPPYMYSADGQSFQLEPDFQSLPAGDYVLTIMDANGCTATVDATITQPAELLVDAGPDVQIKLGYSTSLRAVPNTSPVIFAWEPPDSLSCIDCPNPVANPVKTTTYTITITDESGCTAQDEVAVIVVKARQVYIPNAFSPNADGRNDSFTVYAGPGVRLVQELKVFNRWGGLVFENDNFQPNDPGLGWDGMFKGEPAQIGVYAYYAVVEYLDGETLLFEGDVSVIR